MPSFATQRRVRFTPRQMFDVVADVEQYPKFLPMCESLVIRSRQNTPDGHSILTATMGVGYKAIRETFTTRVTLAPQEPRILVEYLDGPFKRLENRWRFLPDGQAADGQVLNDPQGSIIDFYIDYEFRSHMLGILMGALFDKAFRKFAEAFEDRARLVYGHSSLLTRA
jgi:coenzyme Q-binding protein COQ10